MITEQSFQVFDPTSALASVGGDRKFLSDLVGLIRAAWPAVLADIRKGLAVGDLHSVTENVQLAKMAAEYVSAKRAYDSAVHLELMAGKLDIHGAQQASAQLELEVERLQSVLSAFKAVEDPDRTRA